MRAIVIPLSFRDYIPGGADVRRTGIRETREEDNEASRRTVHRLGGGVVKQFPLKSLPGTAADGPAAKETAAKKV